MTKDIIESGMQVLPLSIISLLLADKKDNRNYYRILLFTLIYMAYQVCLVLPRYVAPLNFINSNWNWDGKITGILFGITCYFLFRRYFRENDFFTFRQQKAHIKKTTIVAVAVVLLMTTIYYFIDSSEFDAETLAFQLTMPGIDEEIMFRGILLGLLMTALPPRISFMGNPAVLLTAILFGFLHAFTLDKNYSVSFEPVYFLHTGIGGYVFGWLTIKSRSILLAVLTHGFTNFFAAWATMIK